MSPDMLKMRVAPVDQKTGEQKPVGQNASDALQAGPAKESIAVDILNTNTISPAIGTQVDTVKGGKGKGDSSKDGKIRKGNSPDENDKTAVAATLPPHGPVLAKAPITFALRSFGISEPVPVEADPFTEATPQAATDITALNGLIAQTPTDAPKVDPAVPAPTDALAPSNGKLAFVMQLKSTDPVPPQPVAQRTSEIPVAHAATVRDAAREAAESISTVPPVNPKASLPQETTRRDGGPETISASRETLASPAVELHSTAPLDPGGPIHRADARNFAIQDVRPVTPEIPKPPTSTEILLHLGSKDQSTASVRMVDRAGTVNVSVHATDPDLRSSLRSNLSDLASQLTGQGFRTEVVRPTVIAANTDNQHQSRHGGQGSQRQHQFTPDGRNPQRDRRPGSERWLDELEQETAGNSGASGGKR